MVPHTPARPADPHSAPRVGIVIRTRDRPMFVVRALRSVLAQTWTDWQVVLVNDGGDQRVLDAALAVEGLARHFVPADHHGPLAGRMIALHNATSVGRSEAFNIGARTLRSALVCCLDDDDTWEPEFLAALVAHFDATRALAPDLGGVAALVSAIREDVQLVDGRETLIPLGEEGLPNAFRRKDFFLNPVAYATYRHDLYPVQWMLDRACVLKVGGFPAAFSVMEDRAFMTRFLEHWRVAILDRVLAHHHRRPRRTEDTAQSVALNTLDNPSYDWRLYSDLARNAVHSPDPDTPGVSAAMLRAVAATLLKEVNDETSAIWRKVEGEAEKLGARLAAIEARVAPSAPMPLDAPALWSLWDRVGSDPVGYNLGVGTPFLDRLTLSMAENPAGLLLHATPARRRMVLQVPETRDWCALELSLDGLAAAGEGLRCDMLVETGDEDLLESALSIWSRDRLGRRQNRRIDPHVHARPPNGVLHITRFFPAALLEQGEDAKLSLALPRQARNFRLICHDIRVQSFMS